MEHKIDSKHSPSLLRLPKDYTKGIFECLQLDDSINLVKSCDHLKDAADEHVFAKYSTFEINQFNYKLNKHIRSYIGAYVTTLTIDCDASKPNWNLGEIVADFKNVRSLKVRLASHHQDGTYQNDLSLSNFDEVEGLTLAYCDLTFSKSFLQNFRKLKSLKIFTTNLPPNELKLAFRSNPGIENFIFCSSARGTDFEFDYRLMELTPNVRRISISVSDDVNINYLANLNQLTKRHINCQWLCVNDGLRVLARNGNLVEIELLNAFINDDLFDILKSFDKLQSLVLTTRSTTPDSSVPWPSNWPSKLKQLRLAGSTITRTNLISTIEHLKLLEIIDIGRSDIPAYNKYEDDDATELAEHLILSVLGESSRPRLDVILPADVTFKNETYIVDSKQLRILYRHAESRSMELGDDYLM